MVKEGMGEVGNSTSRWENRRVREHSRLGISWEFRDPSVTCKHGLGCDNAGISHKV